MRTLILTLGVPAAGKSTWIKSEGLENYTLSPDEIRLQYQAPETTIDGRQGITQKNDGAVWAHLFTLLENRMKNGDLTVVDATHARSSLINRYRALAKTYRYRIQVIDFRDVPLEELHERNAGRGLKAVPPEVIDNMFARVQYNTIPSWVQLVKPDDFVLDTPLPDYSDKYDNIRFIGDVHSCHKQLVKVLEDSYKDNQLTVFIGDLFDRGDDPVDTFRLIQANPNFVLLEGNHDSHLKHYKNWDAAMALGDENYQAFKKSTKIPKPTRHTFHMWRQAGITPKDVSKLRTRYWQLFHARFGDRVLFACHAGYPTIPTMRTSTRDLIKGVGKYEDIETIQQNWLDAVGDSRAVQIHGHRNISKQAPEVVKNKMYNIAGNVEFGGNIVAINVPKTGDIEVFEIKNTEYVPPVPRTLRSTVPVVIDPDSDKLFERMVNHPMVIVKNVTETVFACNFSSKAFKTGTYDDTSTKARGLFIRQDSSIVARGYEKFFNFQENDTTTFEGLTERIEFPVVKVAKPNGFLGLLSYDIEQDDWFIATKGSITSDHSTWFKKQLEPILTDRLKDFLYKNGVTLTFEVIEPKKDPHILKYDEPKLILLDAIYNQEEFKVMSRIDLLTIHNLIHDHVELVQVIGVINNMDELRTDILKLDANKNFADAHQPEGYVYVGANEYRFKFKTRWYRFWKYVRGTMMQVKKAKESPGRMQQLRERMHTAMEHHLVSIMDEHEYANIIAVRDKYLELHNEEKGN